MNPVCMFVILWTAMQVLGSVADPIRRHTAGFEEN